MALKVEANAVPSFGASNSLKILAPKIDAAMLTKLFPNKIVDVVTSNFSTLSKANFENKLPFSLSFFNLNLLTSA